MATAAAAKITTQQASRVAWSMRAMASVLSISDFCASSIAVVLGFRFWAFFNPKIPALQPAMVLTPVLTVAAFFFFGLYPGIGLNAVTQMRRGTHALTLVYLLLTATMFMVKDKMAESRGGFVFAWLFSIAITPVGRLLAYKLLASQSTWGVPTIIIGSGRAALNVILTLRGNKILGYRPVVCISDVEDFGQECADVPIAGSIHRIEQVAAEYGTQHAIVAIPSMPPEQLVYHMRSWSKLFPRILIIPNLAGIASLWTQPRDLGGVLALEIEHNLLDGWNQAIKRLLDIVISLIGILIGAPIVVLCAVLIKWRSPGPIFFTQVREGKEGKTARILKLRSMHPGAEKLLATHLASDAEAASEWRKFYKLKKDPRIIAGIGHFVRRTSIDELPQLWNILKGDMSLVGPRPFPAYHNEQFDPEFRSLRLQVTPGLTGLWQVAARSNGDLLVQEQLDAYYIRNWSLWLDAYILIRTARAVLMPSGSY